MTKKEKNDHPYFTNPYYTQYSVFLMTLLVNEVHYFNYVKYMRRIRWKNDLAI